MNNGLNLSIIEGRLVRDPDLYYTKNGHAMCKMDLAVNENYKINDKPVNDVSYISLNTWNKVAEASAKYLKKGAAIRARGKLKQSSWEDKNGKKNYKVFVDASTVEFLGSPKNKNEKEVETVPF